jgi:hypothetical protein
MTVLLATEFEFLSSESRSPVNHLSFCSSVVLARASVTKMPTTTCLLKLARASVSRLHFPHEVREGHCTARQFYICHSRDELVLSRTTQIWKSIIRLRSITASLAERMFATPPQYVIHGFTLGSDFTAPNK